MQGPTDFLEACDFPINEFPTSAGSVHGTCDSMLTQLLSLSLSKHCHNWLDAFACFEACLPND